jgi:serine/threonine protein kinase
VSIVTIEEAAKSLFVNPRGIVDIADNLPPMRRSVALPMKINAAERLIQYCDSHAEREKQLMSKNRRDHTQVGGWQLQTRLGRGGNGEVYEAEKAGQSAAIKILHTPKWDKKRQARFQDEIEAMKRCEELGCIPVLESDVPETVSYSHPAWFAMRLAESLEDALGEEPTLVEVVSSIRDIAHLLTKIHAMGIAHRDIKPDNLFRYEGRWTVGDFGLAEFDGKLAKTAEGEKIGPVFYIAPEMLNDAVESDGKAADVYSLAKTLWVLITGQRFPLPGTFTKTVEALKASTYVSDARAPLLDAVLEGATNHAAIARPLMGQFARELDAWLNPQTENAIEADLDLSEFAPALAIPKYQMEATLAANAVEQARINETGERIREKLRPFVNQLASALSNANLDGVHGQVDNYFWGGLLQAAVPRATNAAGFARLQMELAGDYQDAKSAKLSATYRVSIDGQQRIDVWTTSTSFLPGGSEEDVEISRLFAAIRGQFKSVVAQVIDMDKTLG